MLTFKVRIHNKEMCRSVIQTGVIFLLLIGFTNCKNPVEQSMENLNVPSGLYAISGDNKVAIRCSADNLVDNYNLYWSTTSGVTPLNGTKIPNVGFQYTHTGLANGVIYYYVMTTIIKGIESQPSEQICAIPRASISDENLDFFGVAASRVYYGTNPVLTNVCENSTIESEDRIILNLYTNQNDSKLTWGLAYPSDNWSSIRVCIPSNIKVRYPYSLVWKDTIFTFGQRVINDIPEPNNIYMWSSPNGQWWTAENEGRPVLTASDDCNSIWHLIWNVAVAVDANDVFHIVAECAPEGVEQQGVGLGYSFSRYTNGKLNFDSARGSSHIFPGGGNPYLYYSKKYDAFLVLHGMLRRATDVFSGKFWWV